MWVNPIVYFDFLKSLINAKTPLHKMLQIA